MNNPKNVALPALSPAVFAYICLGLNDSEGTRGWGRGGQECTRHAKFNACCGTVQQAPASPLYVPYSQVPFQTNRKHPVRLVPDLSDSQERCRVETWCVVVLSSMYLGQRTLLGQRALVGLSKQLFESVPHRVVAPLL